LSSHFFSKNLKFKTYKTIILPTVLYGYEMVSCTMKRTQIEGV